MVVFVVFDEFSVASLMDESLHVDPVRFPNFASLAQTSTWFRNDIEEQAAVGASLFNGAVALLECDPDQSAHRCYDDRSNSSRAQ